MSHEIVRGIKIDEKEGKVYIKSSSNNVWPKSYHWEEYPWYSNFLKEKGKSAVEVELLKGYEEGNLQAGTKNKYTKALQILYNLLRDEYAKFNWRNNDYEYGSEEDKAYRDRREGPEFKELLRKALDTKLPKEKWIIAKPYDGTKVFMRKCIRCAYWTRERSEAKKFDFHREANNTINNFRNNEGWEILPA